MAEFATPSLTPWTRQSMSWPLPDQCGWKVSVGKSRRRPHVGQDHTAPPPSTSRERVQKGAEKPACLFVPSSLPLGTMCSASVTIKSIPLKTGAVQALSPPGDFFCRLFCSLQETLRMLLGTKKERKPSPYIINPKNAGGAAEIQETNGNLIHNVRRGPDSTISRQACAITKIRTLVTHSFNKHSQCITLCASPEGICSP